MAGDNKANPRELALDILMEILEQGRYSHLVLASALDKYQYLEKQDRAFISRLVTGTIEYKLQIDAVLDRFSSTKVRKMKPFIRTLLRMSAYQILYMDRIPDAAVCNEAVKLAVKRKFQGLKGYVNGVLRTISREKAAISFTDLSLKYSMPQWIVDLWLSRYPRDEVEEMLESFLHTKKLTVRCQTDLAPVEEIIRELEDQKVVVIRPEYTDNMLYLDHVDYLGALKAFQMGHIQVQDMSSSLVGLAAAPKKGDFCVDVCGAPGGKSLHLADLLKGTGQVLVRDLSEEKVALIESNIYRAGFENIEAEVWDATVPDPELFGKADIVIADLPCSGLGIIGRKPDIKYRVSREDLESLAALQRKILSVVWQYVKPGGKLIYSTCTIDPLENEENRTWFLEQYPFAPVSLESVLPKVFCNETAAQGYTQLLPGKNPCDGFFISAMVRNKD